MNREKMPESLSAEGLEFAAQEPAAPEASSDAAASAPAAAPRVSTGEPPQRICDVLVIGGGPAGSTAATLLARRGFAVVLLEKSRHPRFHIGESLLPANLPLLEKLGVDEDIGAMGMIKWGIEFVSPYHDHRSFLEFSDAWDKSMPYAYQVRRSEFDHILLRNAQRSGAQVIESCTVRQVDFLPKRAGATVKAINEDGTPDVWRARMVIDASGRDTFLANKLEIKRKNKEHNSSALFAHYEGVERLLGRREGHISIFWFEHGWFWFIPLADGVTSIGAVCWPYYLKSRTKPLDEFFADTIALAPALQERMKKARLVSPVHATGNFSYSAQRSYGDNYLLIGDAYAFIDPVFSSGVLLAMNSAFVAADVVEARFRHPERLPAELRRFKKVMRRGPEEFSWFIYRVTNPAMRELFMAPRNVFRVKEAVLSMLAGDIFGKTPMWRSLRIFRGIYYLSLLFNLRRTLAERRRRKRNIAGDAGAGAETIQEPIAE